MVLGGFGGAGRDDVRVGAGAGFGFSFGFGAGGGFGGGVASGVGVAVAVGVMVAANAAGGVVSASAVVAGGWDGASVGSAQPESNSTAARPTALAAPAAVGETVRTVFLPTDRILEEDGPGAQHEIAPTSAELFLAATES